jgi:hypothetical protein
MLFLAWVAVSVAINGQAEYEKEIAQADLLKAQEEIVRLRDLASRMDYRPLSPALRQELISDLRLVHDRFADTPLRIYTMPRGGTRIRHQVATHRAEILSEAMFNATLPSGSSSEIFRVVPDVELTTAPLHGDLAEALISILSRFITTKFPIDLNEANTGRMWFFINGDPLFMSDGIVTFR